jgi:hypothetical protein
MGNKGERDMSALEQEIFEKFHQLDRTAQQRLIERLQGETTAFDWDDWMARVNSLQAEVRATHGKEYRVDVVSLLRDIREDEG